MCCRCGTGNWWVRQWMLMDVVFVVECKRIILGFFFKLPCYMFYVFYKSLLANYLGIIQPVRLILLPGHFTSPKCCSFLHFCISAHALTSFYIIYHFPAVICLLPFEKLKQHSSCSSFPDISFFPSQVI